MLSPNERTKVQRVARKLGLYLLGLVLGTGLAGAVLLSLSAAALWFSDQARGGLLVAAIAVALARDSFRGASHLLPENRRQIPRDVFSLPEDVGFLQFGFEMGTGARTYMTTGAPWIVAALVVLLPVSWRLGVASVLAFAFGRFVPALAAGLANHSLKWVELGAPLFVKRPAILGSGAVGVAAMAAALPLVR